MYLFGPLRLKEEGQTTLGPALMVSIMIAGSKSGSKVCYAMLCVISRKVQSLVIYVPGDYMY